MWTRSAVFSLVVAIAVAVDHYDAYYQYNLTTAEYESYVANGTAGNCTISVETCDCTERRRIDGTCNNLNYPAAGAARTPYYRVLPTSFNIVDEDDYRPRLAKSGNELPLARKVRTTMVSEGNVPDADITHLAAHILVFSATDITNTRDTTNYVSWRPHCCQAAGASDTACAPNYVPADDPVHRFSGIRCLNMTKPLTYQTSGCLPNTTVPLRIVDATPTFDLSPVYGSVVEPARRANTSGLLVTETINNRTYPPTSGINLLLGINFFGIIFYWRYHNHIATKLAEVNPCWTDDQLFYAAREINIAVAQQHYYYELMPILMGSDNLVADNVVSKDFGFRDLYDDSLLPQISLEYPAVLRWLHLIQDGYLKMYDSEGYYLRQYPIVNLTARIAYIKEDDNMDGITQGCFRQGTGNTKDTIADNDIVQNGLGALQKANDIMTNDLAKHRYFGFQPYINYLAYCNNGINITSFNDLLTFMKPERIQQLRDAYEDVEDIDLLAGLWAETLTDGTYVPPTFYCLIKDQMLRSIQSDRHWYERETRPDAFTEEQMYEIRYGTVARMMCDIGDSVASIQPQAFKMIGDDNVEVSCDEINDIDYYAWQDTTCADAPSRPDITERVPPAFYTS
ncbi:peroxidase-like [Ostrinia nubilalis]|uniref:peroxidase-like n=1 Tax=Ostrinia nubilalis TaxID=29057 RepID=UPI00308257AB